MNEYTFTLLIFLFGAVCVLAGWSMGYGQASDKYKRRLGEQHYQIRDLLADLDKQGSESKYSAYEIATGAADEVSEDWSNWSGLGRSYSREELDQMWDCLSDPTQEVSEM